MYCITDKLLSATAGYKSGLKLQLLIPWCWLKRVKWRQDGHATELSHLWLRQGSQVESYYGSDITYIIILYNLQYWSNSSMQFSAAGSLYFQTCPPFWNYLWLVVWCTACSCIVTLFTQLYNTTTIAIGRSWLTQAAGMFRKSPSKGKDPTMVLITMTGHS